MTTNTERFFLPGNSLQVLATCRDEKYRDGIVATQHRYFVFGGSYDWAFLSTPAAREVGPLRDGDLSSVADRCGN